MVVYGHLFCINGKVMGQLQFVLRPPSIKIRNEKESFMINCTATVAPELPLPSTNWKWKHDTCGLVVWDEHSVKSVFTNGSLLIEQPTRLDSGVYNCSSQFDGQNITASVQVKINYKRGNQHKYLLIN